MTKKTNNTYFANGFLVKKEGDFRVWAVSPTYRSETVDDLCKQIYCDFETNENWAGGVFKIYRLEGSVKRFKKEYECGVPVCYYECGALSVEEQRKGRKLINRRYKEQK